MEQWLVALGIAAISCAAFYTLKKVIFKRLIEKAEQTATVVDELILKSISTPLNIMFVLAAIILAQSYVELAPRHYQLLVQVSKILFIFALVMFMNNLAIGLYKKKKADFVNPAMKSSANLIQTFIHIFIYGSGALILLDSMGVSITPLIASLGIGTLAIALALQETLSNLFSGIYLLLERPLQVGDYVRLESGQEGFIEKISWRSTQIRTPANNMLIIPNNKLSNSLILNFNLPSQEVSMTLEFGVVYGSDLQKVEKTTLEVARQVTQNVDLAVKNSTPSARFKTFDDNGIRLSIVLRVKDFGAQDVVKHELIKALTERYREEGIVISRYDAILLNSSANSRFLSGTPPL